MSNEHSSNLTVEDIRYGSYFDYDLTQWKAIGEYNYQWSDESFSREFKISGGGKTLYLEVEDQEDELRVLVSRKIRVTQITEDVAAQIKLEGNPPDKITYHQTKFRLEETATGEYKDLHAHDGWEPFKVWDYVDDTGNNFLSIEQWEGGDLEAYVGKIVHPDEFTNISPPASSLDMENAGNWISKYGILIGFILFILAQLTVCNKSSSSEYSYNAAPAYSVSEEGLQQVIRDYKNYPDFTVLLSDMSYQDEKFYHIYQVLLPEADSIQSKTTDWKLVSPKFFQTHKEHLGMELASQKDGVLSEKIAPPGFSNFVGNEKYGQWERQNDGSQVWRFLAQYALLNALMNGGFGAPRYSNWDRYNRTARGVSNYTGSGNQYGTRNYLRSSRGRRSNWGLMPLQNRQQAEQRSSGVGGRSSRSGNRYSNRSSRSRSGGSGK